VTPRLDATPAGEPLYQRWGSWRVGIGAGCWTVDRRRAGPRGAAPLESTDGRRSSRWTFALRRCVLRSEASRRQAPDTWVLDGTSGPRGYLFRRHGRASTSGHWSRSAGRARLLLGSCLAALPERPVFLDVPVDRQAFRTFVSAQRFVVERPFLRMFRGRLTAPGEPSLIYAIAGPEFG
jgi:hypothetical protein